MKFAQQTWSQPVSRRILGLYSNYGLTWFHHTKNSTSWPSEPACGRNEFGCKGLLASYPLRRCARFCCACCAADWAGTAPGSLGAWPAAVVAARRRMPVPSQAGIGSPFWSFWIRRAFPVVRLVCVPLVSVSKWTYQSSNDVRYHESPSQQKWPNYASPPTVIRFPVLQQVPQNHSVPEYTSGAHPLHHSRAHFLASMDSILSPAQWPTESHPHSPETQGGMSHANDAIYLFCTSFKFFVCLESANCIYCNSDAELHYCATSMDDLLVVASLLHSGSTSFLKPYLSKIKSLQKT